MIIIFERETQNYFRSSVMLQASDHFSIGASQVSTLPDRKTDCVKVKLVYDLGIWFSMSQ